MSQDNENQLSIFQMMAAETARLSRFLFAARHGLMYGGKRDVYTALGYTRNLSYRDYYEKYDRQDIAKRLVEAAPKATWRSHPTIVDDEDPEKKTAFERDWEDLAKRLRIFQRLERADILGGIGRYGVLMIGLANQPPSNEEAVPVNGEGDVLYLQPFSEDQAIIAQFDEDPTQHAAATHQRSRQMNSATWPSVTCCARRSRTRSGHDISPSARP